MTTPDPKLTAILHEKIADCPEDIGHVLGWALGIASGAQAIGMTSGPILAPVVKIALTDEERAYLRGDHDGERVQPNDPRWEKHLAIADSLVALGLLERVPVFNFFGECFSHKITDLGRAALRVEPPWPKGAFCDHVAMSECCDGCGHFSCPCGIEWDEGSEGGFFETYEGEFAEVAGEGGEP